MRRKRIWVVALTAAIGAGALYTRIARATPADKFSGTTLAVGRFGKIDVFNHLVAEADSQFEKHKRNVWLSWQKTKGPSDLYVQANTWQPGGTTGWHTHPGHSLIIVTAGTVTVYDGDDPDCKPAVYSQGMGFVDPGGDHAHIIRNESDAPASTLAVQLIPAGAARRIDLEDPGNCRF
jgi:uncharacterized RmlC-like cupin family protein